MSAACSPFRSTHRARGDECAARGRGESQQAGDGWSHTAIRRCSAKTRCCSQGAPLRKSGPRVGHGCSASESLRPLEAAANYWHPEVARELMRQLGIKGYGGASGGRRALQFAAHENQMQILEMVTDAGVVDEGSSALRAAVILGCKAPVKFLLQQELSTSGDGAYVSALDRHGEAPLAYAVRHCPYRSGFCSTRIARLLVDAGVDTMSAARLTNCQGDGTFNGTPLALATHMLREKKTCGEHDATKEQLHGWRASGACCCGWRWFARSLGCGRSSALSSPTMLQRIQARSRRFRPR